jgi:hypothetical protein
MGLEQRGRVILPNVMTNQKWEEFLEKAKSYQISKQVVVDAWKHVKANKGAAGVDSETISDFEENLNPTFCE